MKYDKLIEKLEEPMTHEGQPLTGGCLCDMKPMMKPILIGDIAFRIAEKYHAEEFTKINGLKINDFKYSNVPELFYLWYLCGKNKSLQQIAEMEKCTFIGKDSPKWKLKPSSEALLSFIEKLS